VKSLMTGAIRKDTMALPRLTITFDCQDTKKHFLDHLISFETLNVDPNSIHGSLETTESIHINYGEKSGDTSYIM
jgi:hypothetical protein